MQKRLSSLTICIKYTAEVNKLKEMLNILLHLPSNTTTLFQYQHNRWILYLNRVWWSVADRNFNNTLDCFPPLNVQPIKCLIHVHTATWKVQYGRSNTGLTVPSVKCIGNNVQPFRPIMCNIKFIYFVNVLWMVAWDFYFLGIILKGWIFNTSIFNTSHLP